jgi:hypothetical protein
MTAVVDASPEDSSRVEQPSTMPDCNFANILDGSTS